MTEPELLSSADIDEFHKELSNWGRWGTDDQLGTLNLITPEKRKQSAQCIQSGVAIGCSRPLPTEPGPHNQRPVEHHMIGTCTEGWGGDWFGLAVHGFATSHIDALCHIFHQSKLYNGYPIEEVTAHGALKLSIDALRDGIVSRGVLLDIPGAKGRDHLEPGEPILLEDLKEAEQFGRVAVEPGDVLFVRTGRWKLYESLGEVLSPDSLAGLHASCLPWLHERGIAALGSDAISDVLPSRVEGVMMPVHSVAIASMGLHLIDNLDFERLSEECRRQQRWAFQLVIAPLVIERATGSPVTPIAIF
ncbi:MAG: cyclase family protein [Pseudomonadales bacterium]